MTVRLRRGDYDEQITYEEDPVSAAVRFVEDGARALHIVDLDGARSGQPRHLETLAAIRERIDCEIEYGGGLRTLADLDQATRAGADHLILGTAAIRDGDLLEAALDHHDDRVTVSIDARSGLASAEGWTSDSGERAAELIARMQDAGVRRFVYSAIERDGTLEGPAIEELLAVDRLFQHGYAYAGGIGSLDDLRALKESGARNLAGVISGRAIHEGRFTVADGIGVLGE